MTVAEAIEKLLGMPPDAQLWYPIESRESHMEYGRVTAVVPWHSWKDGRGQTVTPENIPGQAPHGVLLAAEVQSEVVPYPTGGAGVAPEEEPKYSVAAVDRMMNQTRETETVVALSGMRGMMRRYRDQAKRRGERQLCERVLEEIYERIDEAERKAVKGAAPEPARYVEGWGGQQQWAKPGSIQEAAKGITQPAGPRLAQPVDYRFAPMTDEQIAECLGKGEKGGGEDGC